MASTSILHLLPLLSLLVVGVAPDGWLGVYLEPDRDEAVVAEVIPDSPAAKAGLQLGDVVVRLGEVAPVGREQLRAALAAGKPGDRLVLVVRRGAAEHRVVVRLGERPDPELPKPEAGARPTRPGTPPQPAGEARPAGATPPSATPGAPPTPASHDTAGKPATRAAAGQGGGGAASAASGADRPEAQPKSAKPPSAVPAAGDRRDVDAELQALRAELAELRRQLEAMRKAGGRE